MKKVFEKIFTELPPFLVFSAINNMLETEPENFVELSNAVKQEELVISIEDELVTVYTAKHRYRFVREDIDYRYSWELQGVLKRIANKVFVKTVGDGNTRFIRDYIALEVFSYFKFTGDELFVSGNTSFKLFDDNIIKCKVFHSRYVKYKETSADVFVGLTLLLNLIKMFSVSNGYFELEYNSSVLNWDGYTKLLIESPPNRTQLTCKEPATFNIHYLLELNGDDELASITHFPTDEEKEHDRYDYTYGRYYSGYEFIRGILFLMSVK